ncbi:MATE family efflux transporter [Aquimarina sediminis]|uniref:MATE family efflux transporter n=1 Tax=Aquimarina sediminis TaxID=2070536 RepID=UPI000CA015A5|nr:MATE family efflux transporter [Aquimarina sediminis]
MNQILLVFRNEENQKLLKKMFLNSLPLAFAGLLSVLIGFIDAFYLSNYSLDAFKALSLVIPILGIVGSIGIAIGAALINSIANYERAGKKDVVYFSTLFLTIFCYVVIALGAFLFHDSFSGFNDLNLDSNQTIQEYFTEYWFAIIPLYLLVLIINIITQYLSYRDNNREIINVLLIVVFLNVILNPLLIFYFDLGVRGAAWASILSLFFGIVFFSMRDNRLVKLGRLLSSSFTYAKQMGVVIKAQFKVAFSVFLAIAIFAIGSIFFNQLAIKQGSEFLALIGLIEQLKLMMIFPTRGVTGSFLIMFEKSIAEKETQKYWKIYWSATLIIGLICLIEGVLIFVFSDSLLNLFNIESDSSRDMIAILLTSLYLYFLVNILPRASQVGFITLGKSYLLFLQSLFSILLGYLFTYFLVEYFGKKWFVDGQTIGVLVATTVFLILFRNMLNQRIHRDT